MHLAFVLFFFGNPFSWFYYSYVLVLGIAATSAGQTATRNVVVWGLALIALIGEKSYLYDSTTRWLASAREPTTAELWAPADERAEWQKVVALIKGVNSHDHSAALLARTGCAELLFPEFLSPVSLFLDPGLATKAEMMRKRAQIQHASTVVIATRFLNYTFESDLASRTLIFHGKFFDVYR
jgi:hypothetical protein